MPDTPPTKERHVNTADPSPTPVVEPLAGYVDVYKFQAELIELRKLLVEPEMDKAALEAKLARLRRALAQDQIEREELVAVINADFFAKGFVDPDSQPDLRKAGRLEKRIEDRRRSIAAHEQGVARLERKLRELRRREAQLLEEIEDRVKDFNQALTVESIIAEVDAAVAEVKPGPGPQEPQSYAEAVRAFAAPSRSEYSLLEAKVTALHEVLEILLGAEEAALVAAANGANLRDVARRKFRTVFGR